jgi:hypothetical protein
MRYEFFCDIAYFDQWAVRPVGVSRWGHCYHLPSKEEAEGLAKQLEELERKLGRIERAAMAVVQRWDQPSWKDAEPTAAVINKLRNALEMEEE